MLGINIGIHLNILEFNRYLLNTNFYLGTDATEAFFNQPKEIVMGWNKNIKCKKFVWIPHQEESKKKFTKTGVFYYITTLALEKQAKVNKCKHFPEYQDSLISNKENNKNNMCQNLLST